MGIVGQGKTRGTSTIINIESTINQNMVGIITNLNVLPEIIDLNLKVGYHFIRNGNGSNQEALNSSIVKNIKIGVPSLEEQKTIIEHIEVQSNKTDRAISLQAEQISMLKEYKSTLIDSAVTGKIKL
jgi:type I restriction enzyme S subunit